MTSIMWFRRDLRLTDNPALLAAAGDGDVVPLVVIDPAVFDDAGVRRAGFLRCVEALDAATGGRLVVRTGDPVAVVPALASEVGASRVHVSAESEPYGRRRDESVREVLGASGVELVATGTPYAIGPGVITRGDGGPYRVFTPFARAWRAHGAPGPAPRPRVTWVSDVPTEAVPDLPATPFEVPELGEDAAHTRWAEFLDDGLAHYGSDRNRPDLDATSRLSMHLTYGTIHPRTLLADLGAHPSVSAAGVERFVTELIWREFYADVLWWRPDSEWGDLRTAMAGMEYDDPEADDLAADRLEAWRQGRTGYPIVDAGMRQLLTEGWMHNRVRMITASFLVKDLHIRWQHGARHFLTHLLDGDPASNNHGWQWVAGTGTDAAPYFRIFNPSTQGERFDPEGRYVRRHVPELADLTGKDVHDLRLSSATGGYALPIVDHAAERRESLRRYEATR